MMMLTQGHGIGGYLPERLNSKVLGWCECADKCRSPKETPKPVLEWMSQLEDSLLHEAMNTHMCQCFQMCVLWKCLFIQVYEGPVLTIMVCF